jgi:hypothetical protein
MIDSISVHIGQAGLLRLSFFSWSSIALHAHITAHTAHMLIKLTSGVSAGISAGVSAGVSATSSIFSVYLAYDIFNFATKKEEHV